MEMPRAGEVFELEDDFRWPSSGLSSEIDKIEYSAIYTRYADSPHTETPPSWLT